MADNRDHPCLMLLSSSTVFLLYSIISSTLGASPGPLPRNELIEGGSKVPLFNGHIQNISVAVGRDASFVCNVKNLGKFRVGWVKSDTKAIQAIHDTVITYNPRIEVSGDFKTTFILTIKTIKEEDAGDYMCQINTDPMLSQGATLNVMVPPDIDMSLTTPDLELREGETATLRCFGKGRPQPEIAWRIEDGKNIRFKTPVGLGLGKRFNGSILVIPKVTEEDMGAYLCIAHNGAPPAVSKRMYLNVQFPPKINSPRQMVAATLGSEVTLKCNVRGYPKALIYWLHKGSLIGEKSSRHYEIQETPISTYEFISTLIVKKVTSKHMGKFHCVAKNSLGEDDMHTRVYMVSTPPTHSSHTTPSSSSSNTFDFFQDRNQEWNEVSQSEKNTHPERDSSDQNLIHLEDKRIDMDKYNTLSFNNNEEDSRGTEGEQRLVYSNSSSTSLANVCFLSIIIVSIGVTLNLPD